MLKNIFKFKFYIIAILIIVLTSSYFIYEKKIHNEKYIITERENVIKITYKLSDNEYANGLVLSGNEEFLKSARENYDFDPKLAQEQYKNNNNESVYVRDVDYNKYTYRDYISHVFDIYEYTGGAHGLRNKFGVVYRDGKLINDLNELISPNYGDKLIQEVKTKALAMIQERDTEPMSDYGKQWFDDGTKKEVIMKSPFWIKDGQLIIYISQYQITAYAFGDFEIEIPLSDIGL